MAEAGENDATAGPATAEDAVARLYRAILGREPDAAERAASPADEAGLSRLLLDSVEYRNRFRDADWSDGNTRQATALWPRESRPLDLHILIVSGDPWSKARRSIDQLAPRLTERMKLTLVCGQADAAPLPDHPRITLALFPGESIFQLRTRLPTLFAESAWIAVLEDHSVPTDGWLDAVMAAIDAADDETLAFTGMALNLDSTSPWSWANFLFNFYQHWSPGEAERLTGTVATALFRRDIVGVRPLPLFHFEEFLLGRLMVVRHDMTVNHIQHTTGWEATIHVIDNGMVYGASLRRNSPAPRKALIESVGWVVGGRMKHMAEVLARHPAHDHLPRGTRLRLRWIAWCHSLGVVKGALLGGGRAHIRLE
jgi:hypothetical protein